ncbi:TonB-dependent receptor [Spirosoma montaniterrae]|uniref:TonB-dependent receptor n=1 Tax=Spirosoma montaniterrae TaxID=1178516 RepID=A0A1P9X032_9BACT|nr:TonB-dependent receptor [Spirosoma montaniterrae]AQG80996.1 TonB-dependent receptor [Spirosoma montaniterrae]
MKRFFYINTILLICGVTTALAQNSVNVTVLQLTRQTPVSGVTVYLENPAIGLSTSARTNAQGQLQFTALPLNGTYRIFTREEGDYLEATSDNIELRTNASRSVTLLLPTKTERTLSEVNVRGTSTSRINTINAEVSSEISARQVQELPVEGRDITRVLFRLPNVSQATGFFPEAPNVSINGANGLFNNYLIDGQDNNERFLGGQRFAMPIGFVRNISVLTNNYTVEFGNTGNGIINLTSRSGSNQTTGEAFFLTRPGPGIDGTTPYPQRDLSGNQVQNGFQRYQGGFAIGGALVQNKTFYYVNYEHTTDLKDNALTAPALGVNEIVRGNNSFNYFSAKLDQFWSTRFHSSLRANVGLIAIGRQAGGLTGGIAFPSAANAQDRNSLTIANKNIYSTDRFTSETNLQYARFRWNYARPVDPNSPNVTVLDQQGVAIAALGHPGYVFDQVENTFQLQQKLTFYRGNHTIRTGAELISGNHQLSGGGNPNGSYTVQLTAEQLNVLRSRNLGSSLSPTDIPADARVLGYSVELRPASFGKTQNIVSAYLEDQWSVNDKLNLTLGLRYDYDNLSKGGAASGDFNNIAPRFSANYKLGGRSTLRGGIGLFYDKILYAIYSDALQQNNSSPDFRRELHYFVNQGILPASTDLDRVTFDGNLSVGGSSNAGVPIRYLQGPPASSFAGQRNLFSGERRILNPNGYQNPYTVQASVGYQYQINTNTLFYVDAVYNHSRNLFRTRNLNAPVAWNYDLSGQNGVARSSAWADSTRPLPIYPGGFALIDGQRVTGVAQSVVMTETAGESKYYALSFNLQRDRVGNSPFAYRLIYTLSSLKNNTEDINFRAMDANNFAAEWGPSINDRRHIINGIFNYYPVKNLTVTVAALLQSGQPINRIPDASRYFIVNSKGQPILTPTNQRIFTNDLNGDGSAFGDAYVGNSDRHPGQSRNSDRLPWSKTVDLSAQYQFRVYGEKGRIEVRADVFNVLNTVNLSGYSNNATQSNQIQVGPPEAGIVRRNAAPPRQFQFGVRYLF